MARMLLVRHPLLQASAFLALVSACTVSAGKHGRLGFAYASDDGLVSASMTLGLAQGQDVDVVVFAARDPAGQPVVSALDKSRLERSSLVEVPVLQVESAAPAVVEVMHVSGSHVRIFGRTRGTAALTVHTARGTDTIPIRVVPVSHVEIRHFAWLMDREFDPARTVLVRGGIAHFSIRQVAADGRSLTGYGASDVISLAPAGIATVVNASNDSQHLRIMLADSRPRAGAGVDGGVDRAGGNREASRLAVIPQGGTGLSFELIEPDEIVRVRIESPLAPSPARLSVGADRLLESLVFSRDGRRVLGLDGVLTVLADTRATCEIHSVSSILSDGYHVVRGKSPGPCAITAVVGNQTASYSIEIVGAPE